MKTRPSGFLSEENIDHDSEPFSYISELHDYLWRFIRAELPGAGGHIHKYLDVAVEQIEFKKREDSK